MQTATIKALPKGEYIKRTATAKAVYIKGEYCRTAKAFECSAADDINRTIYIKAAKAVFYGFTY